MPLGDIAESLKLTRQGLNHHLRKDQIDGNFERLIKNKIGIERGENGIFYLSREFYGAEEPKTHYQAKTRVPVYDLEATAGEFEWNGDIYAIMRQLRHSDLKMTQIYLKSLGLTENTAMAGDW